MTGEHNLFYSGSVSCHSNQGGAYGAYYKGKSTNDKLSVNFSVARTYSENPSAPVYDYYRDSGLLGGNDFNHRSSNFTALGPVVDPKKVGASVIPGQHRRIDFPSGSPDTLFAGPKPESVSALNPLTALSVHFIPVDVNAPIEVSKMRFYIAFAYPAGTRMRAGIYNCQGGLIRQGSGVAANTAGIKEDALTGPTVLAPGKYLFALMCESGGGQESPVGCPTPSRASCRASGRRKPPRPSFRSALTCRG